MVNKYTLHTPVLLEETIDSLKIKKDGIYVDGTVGYGGHSQEILKKLSTGMLICIDQDKYALEQSKKILKGNVTFIEDNFSNIKSILEDLKISKVDGIILDLGVSSVQLDFKDRGFSYREDSKLDMRMNQNNPLTAEVILNTYSLDQIFKIIRDYGEEKYAYSIAKNIIKEREKGIRINSTLQLVDIIKRSMPSSELRKKGHPAKQTFQAIRIAVNNELGNLERFLEDSKDLLNKHGRISIITFHSLEDRIVKQYFKGLAFPKSTIPKNIPIMENIKRDFELLSNKAIFPTEEEIENNRRSKSAILRGIIRV